MSCSKDEAKRRIEEAKKIVEFRMQADLDRVGNMLSRVTHCPEWDEVHELYDKVKSFWYKLDDRQRSSKIDLDSEEKARLGL